MRHKSRVMFGFGAVLMAAWVVRAGPLEGQAVESRLLLDWDAGRLPGQVDAASLAPAPLFPVTPGSVREVGPRSMAAVAGAGRSMPAPSPVQSQESGGFPYLQVGVGLGVAALMIGAVLTANSGDAAELPRGGVVIVVPGS